MKSSVQGGAPRGTRSWLAGAWLGLVLVLGLTDPGWAYEQRRNTASVGFQAGYGLFQGQDGYTFNNRDFYFYDIYDAGFALGIHLRYSVDRRSAIGFSFEDLRFDRDGGTSEDPEQYQVNNFLARYYVYFARREKISRYLVGGVGFHRPSFRTEDGDSVLPGEGFTANLGAGLEYFLNRTLSIDASIDGYLLRPKGGSATAAGARVGVHYYFVRG